MTKSETKGQRGKHAKGANSNYKKFQFTQPEETQKKSKCCCFKVKGSRGLTDVDSVMHKSSPRAT